ncbi:hypothetical protein PG997_003856 [Apiospora hydei]|uniref:Chitin-binding type-1 domain-containing protein n=1 Tax=Apiospora hydei TaxID=1337664 RepID=A0ABR1X0F5_9PEZI
MRLSIILVMQSIGGLAVGMEKYAPLPNVTIYQRQVTSCEQTYGAGAQFCGGPSSRFCFKPDIGQTCCPDYGYCDKGFYCAPVARYCCTEGEDLATCARNAGFVLPASLAYSTAGFASASPTGVTEVTPFLPESPTDVPTSSGIISAPSVESVQASSDQSTTLPDTGGDRVTAAPASTSVAAGNFDVPRTTTVVNATIPPVVQVSAVGKHGVASFGTLVIVWETMALIALGGVRFAT